jgi:hypothetical protein
MSLKLILFYIIGFIILYLEPIPISGITFGILWKIILIAVLFFPVLYQSFKSKYIEIFAFILILFAVKILISYSSMDYIMNTFTLFFKALMLPILYLYFILKVRERTLVFLAKHFSILIIISFIPYMLGILTPLGEGYDLSAYGLDGQYGLVGPFIRPHSASISIAFALIIITRSVNKNNKKIENIFLALLLILGVYELMATYVRTGLAIYLVTIFYLFMRNFNIKKFIMLVLTFFIVLSAGFYLYQTNEIVKMRFNDNNKYVDDGGLGSGRLLYWETSIDNWLGEDAMVVFIGLGEEYALDKMEEHIGERLFAHSEFFQVLQQEGLIGFILFILSLLLLYVYIQRYKSSKYFVTASALYIGVMVEMLFQGGFYFNIILLFSIYLALLKKEKLCETY